MLHSTTGTLELQIKYWDLTELLPHQKIKTLPQIKANKIYFPSLLS